MDLWAVHRYIHTLGTQKTIWRTRFFVSVCFTGYVSNMSRFKRSGPKPPTEAPQLSKVLQVAMSAPLVPANIFTGTLQDILGFTNTQVWILADDGYGSQESVMYWIFTNIKELCQLKSNTPEIHGGVSYVHRKIKCLQALDWWVTDLTLQGININLNNFKT